MTCRSWGAAAPRPESLIVAAVPPSLDPFPLAKPQPQGQVWAGSQGGLSLSPSSGSGIQIGPFYYASPVQDAEVQDQSDRVPALNELTVSNREERNRHKESDFQPPTWDNGRVGDWLGSRRAGSALLVEVIIMVINGGLASVWYYPGYFLHIISNPTWEVLTPLYR